MIRSDYMSLEGLITSVEQQRKSLHRFNIFVNDQYAFSVHEDVLVKHRLIKGERINPEQIEQVLRDEEQQKAYAEALEFIGRRPRSNHEVRQKLVHKGYQSYIIDRVIARLFERKYIDDEQFAKIWTDHRIHSQKKGRKWVEQELISKGVSKENILGAMAQLHEEDEYRNAHDLALKKWIQQNDVPQRQKKQKIAAFLLRRGFPNSIVRRVIVDLSDTKADDEA